MVLSVRRCRVVEPRYGKLAHAAGFNQILMEEPKVFPFSILATDPTAVWARNRKCAEEAGAEVSKSAQELERRLKKMKESVSMGTSQEALHKEAMQCANSLCALSNDVLTEFGQWRNFQNEAELTVLHQIVDPTSRCLPTISDQVLFGARDAAWW